MNKLRLVLCTYLLMGSISTIHPYQIKASNFFSPSDRRKRRLEKNLALAVSLNQISKLPEFNEHQKDIFKALPKIVNVVIEQHKKWENSNILLLTPQELMTELNAIQTALEVLLAKPNQSLSASLKRTQEAIKQLIEEMKKNSPLLNPV